MINELFALVGHSVESNSYRDKLLFEFNVGLTEILTVAGTEPSTGRLHESLSCIAAQLTSSEFIHYRVILQLNTIVEKGGFQQAIKRHKHESSFSRVQILLNDFHDKDLNLITEGCGKWSVGYSLRATGVGRGRWKIDKDWLAQGVQKKFIERMW